MVEISNSKICFVIWTWDFTLETRFVKLQKNGELLQNTLPLGKHIRIFGLVFHTVKEVIQIHSVFPHIDNG